MSLHSVIELDACALSHAIHQRQVSCEEVMQAYLAHIHRLNPQVNAIVSLQPDETLLKQAREHDRLLARGQSMGWMHGFPQAPKDLAAAAGLPHTMGSPALAHQVARADDWMVQRMRAAGAILIGKTNTPEFGLGSHTYNPLFGITRNAWNPKYSAGGSSGGTAVAVALHMLPVADGSDMMGSLRNPAAWNHIYGLRPSLGRVPEGPSVDLFYQQLGCKGPMARTPQDLAYLLSIQAGHHPRSPLSLAGDGREFQACLQANLHGRRIAWMRDYEGHLPTEPGVLDLCEKALPHFETLGCTVHAQTPRFNMQQLWTCWLRLRGFLVANNLRALYNNPTQRELLKPEARWEVEHGLQVSTTDLHQAYMVRTQWYEALMALFEDFDYLALPTAQVFAFEAEKHWPDQIAGRPMDTYHRWMEVTISATLAGLPAINLPAGFSSQGTPMGLQIIGKPRADFELLQLANGWHQVNASATQRSPLLHA